jgi:hypothetical protein
MTIEGVVIAGVVLFFISQNVRGLQTRVSRLEILLGELEKRLEMRLGKDWEYDGPFWTVDTKGSTGKDAGAD